MEEQLKDLLSALNCKYSSFKLTDTDLIVHAYIVYDAIEALLNGNEYEFYESLKYIQLQNIKEKTT